MKKLVVASLSIAMLVVCSGFSQAKKSVKVSSKQSVSSAAVQLKDIKNHWAEESILEMVNKGIVHGYPDKTFKPENQVTRAEFASMLSKALPNETPNAKEPFVDVSDSYWGKDATAKGVELGFISPADYPNGKFGPEQTMKRSEIAKWLANGLASQGAEYKQAINDTQSTLLPITEFYKGGLNQKDIPYIAVVMGTGLLVGYDDSRFNPMGNTTRSEVASIISRYLKVIEKKPSDFLHLNELREVGRTGTNVISLTDYEYGASKDLSHVINKPITFKNNVGVVKLNRLIFVDSKSVYSNMSLNKGANRNADYYNVFTEMTFTPAKNSRIGDFYQGTSNPLLGGWSFYGETAQSKFGLKTVDPYNAAFTKGVTTRFWMQNDVQKTLRPGDTVSSYWILTDDGSRSSFAITN